MWSFFKPARSPAPTVSAPGRDRDDPWSATNQDDYDEITLSTTSATQTSSTSQCPTISTAQTAYPPLPSFSRPASSAAYPLPLDSFKSLYTILHDSAPHLMDNLADPVLPDALELASLEQAIAPYRLPRAVKEAWAVHDGELAGTGAGGLFYGLRWMGVEEAETEWRVWRQLEEGGAVGGDPFLASARGPKAGRAHPYIPEGSEQADESSVPGMSGFPAGWVRPVYSHPGWLPLITDHAGNYIGVDLDPPPPVMPDLASTSGQRLPNSVPSAARSYGQPGQVIAFGRELDEKTVLFPGDGPGGFGRFLAAFVDDVGKAEFARLASLNGSPPLGRRDPLDEESGGAKRTNSDDDDWSRPDGLGADYIGGAQFGESGGDATEETWILGRKATAWLNSREGHGGTIGALAELSRRKWRSVGVGSRARPQAQPLPRGPMRTDLLVSTTDASGKGKAVVSSGEDEDEPQSAVTERAAPRQGADLIGTATPDLNGDVAVPEEGAGSNTLSPGLILQPPSPVASRAPQSRQPSPGGSSTASGRLLGSPHPSRSNGTGQRPIRKRPPPPPPAMIDLPTAGDLTQPVWPSEDELTKSPEPTAYSGLPLHRAPSCEAELTRQRHASSGSAQALFEGEDGPEVELQAVVVLGEKVQGLAISTPTGDQPYA